MMNVRVEDLIEEVKKWPLLWDPTLTEYKRKNMRKDAWQEVCSALVEGFSEKGFDEKENIERRIFSKWRTVRDGYIKCRRRESDEPYKCGFLKASRRYIYADYLTFLDRVISLKACAEIADGSYEEICYEGDQDASVPSIEGIFTIEQPIGDACSSSDTSTFTMSRESPETHENQAKRKFSVDESSRKTRRYYQDDDGDVAFFESLLPMMKNLDHQRKLKFRMSVMSSLHQLL